MLGSVVDNLCSDVDDLVAAVASVDDDAVWADVGAQLLRLEELRERFDHAIGTLVASCEARGAHVADGARSMADWLSARTGQARAVVGGRSWLAARLRSMPGTDAALAEGDITGSHARVLTRALTPRTVEEFERDEGLLVDVARATTADQLAQVVAHWLHHVDPDGSAPDPEGVRDVFHLSMTLDGRLKGDLDLGGEAALRVKAVLDEATDQLFRREKDARVVDPTDPRASDTRSQRRARALVELLDRAASSSASPARRQPLFTITTTLDTMARHGDPFDWRTEVDLAWRAALPGRLVDKLSCDGHVGRVLLAADGEPLDVGRTKRVATPAQRRALLARFGGCAVPGCSAPPGQVEIHHIVPWGRGGPTDLDNLVPQCSWHHHRVHDGSLTVVRTAEGVAFELPDGRRLVDPRAGPNSGAA